MINYWKKLILFRGFRLLSLNKNIFIYINNIYNNCFGLENDINIYLDNIKERRESNLYFSHIAPIIFINKRAVKNKKLWLIQI